MKMSFDKLKFKGEECSDNNWDKAISEPQFRTMRIIEKYFKDTFNGNTFGEAWDFIKLYVNRTYTDDNGIIKTPFKSSRNDGKIEWKGFYLENIGEINKPDIDFQEDYFHRRYEALKKGEVQCKDDRILDELTDDFNENKREIIYDINVDDEQLD